MRWLRLVPLGLCVMCLVVSAAIWSCTPAAQQQAATGMTSDQKLARGHYLITVLGCGDCHTPGGLYGGPDSTRRLAGSELGWKGPWGISFPRNLTPDVETGIGSWTEDQIVTTLREGRRPDGSPLLPPMPWPDFAHLTDDDAHSIAAALKSLPPVRHPNLKSVPPGEKYTGAYLEFPPPPAWDAPKAPMSGTPSGGVSPSGSAPPSGK